MDHDKLQVGDRVQLSRGKTGIVKFIGKSSDITADIKVPGTNSATVNDNEDIFGIELDKWSIYGNDGKNVFQTSKGKGYFARRCSIINIMLPDNLLDESTQQNNIKKSMKFYQQQWDMQKCRVNTLIDELTKSKEKSTISEQCVNEYSNLIQFVDTLFDDKILDEKQENKGKNVSNKFESDQNIDIKYIEEKYEHKEKEVELKIHSTQTRNDELQKQNIQLKNHNVELESQIAKLTDQLKSLRDSKYKLIKSTSTEIDNLRQKIKSSSNRNVE